MLSLHTAVKESRAACLKLAMLLVNVSLKQILQIHCYFLWKNVRILAKDSHIFPTKSNGVFAYVVGICLAS